MDFLVCVKRVPATGGRIRLLPGDREIDTRYASFTVSPHEECAVEEALRQTEKHGGSVTVLTLGPAVAADQLRDGIAMGAHRAIHLQTDGSEWDPGQTAKAIIETIRTQEASGSRFDLILFGNEAADSGDYQVGIRVAYALGRPVVTGIKALDIADGKATVRREASGGWEIFEIPLPAVLTAKEGINLPRYPTVPGRLRAKRAPIETVTPQRGEAALEMIRLKLPPATGEKGEILGQGAGASPRLVEVLQRIGVMGS